MEKAKNCPDCEIIEEYRDGTASEEWTRHIEGCDVCQRRIAALDLLDMRMRTVCAPPAGLSGRIKAAVHEGREPSVRPYGFWRTSWFRGTASAAVLVVLLSATMLLALRSGAEREAAGTAMDGALNENAAVDEAVSVEADGTGIAAAKAANEMAVDFEGNAARGLREDDVVRIGKAAKAVAMESPVVKREQERNLKLVGVEDGRARQTETLVAPRAIVGDSVRHIWSVQDATEAREYLARVLGEKGRRMDYRGDRSAFEAVAQLTDAELQDTVDTLSKHGWKLLSPHLPQPGKREELRMTGRPVTYNLEIIGEAR